jgi:gluconokinase
MPASLLASQLAALEPLGPGEVGASVDAGLDLDEVVAAAVEVVKWADASP